MVIDAPGSCDLVLAIAVRSHGGAAVITGDTAQLLGPLAPAAHLSRDVRTFVVDSAGTVLSPGQLPAAAPAYLRALLDSDAPGPARTVNYAVGDGRALGSVDRLGAQDGPDDVMAVVQLAEEADEIL